MTVVALALVDQLEPGWCGGRVGPETYHDHAAAGQPGCGRWTHVLRSKLERLDFLVIRRIVA